MLWCLENSLPSESAPWDCSASLLPNTLSSVCRLQHTCHSMQPVWSHPVGYVYQRADMNTTIAAPVTGIPCRGSWLCEWHSVCRICRKANEARREHLWTSQTFAEASAAHQARWCGEKGSHRFPDQEARQVQQRTGTAGALGALSPAGAEVGALPCVCA